MSIATQLGHVHDIEIHSKSKACIAYQVLLGKELALA